MPDEPLGDVGQRFVVEVIPDDQSGVDWHTHGATLQRSGDATDPSNESALTSASESRRFFGRLAWFVGLALAIIGSLLLLWAIVCREFFLAMSVFERTLLEDRV